MERNRYAKFKEHIRESNQDFQNTSKLLYIRQDHILTDRFTNLHEKVSCVLKDKKMNHLHSWTSH